jgi:putative addiction module component (TIGR02574 family)
VNSDLEKIEGEALSLSAQERARLVMNLIKSPDDYDETDAESLWLEEAERRYREYKKGKVKGRPADDVYREAFSKVQ